MKTYQITIDGLAYKGEDPEREYDSGGGNLGTSFHTYNGSLLNELLIEAGDPKVIVGGRGLRGEIERIERRIADGRISPRCIVIEVGER